MMNLIYILKRVQTRKKKIVIGLISIVKLYFSILHVFFILLSIYISKMESEEPLKIEL